MKLLCATDLQPRSDIAVDRAYRLREELGACLKLVHVVAPGGADEGTLEQRLLSASSRLALRARHAAGPAELVVRCGRPASVVSEESATSDLIIVGAHDEHGPVDALRGRFTSKVLTEARRPVLIARRPAIQPYGRLLLALDGSQATGQVVRLSERLPVAKDAAFAVVHAHEPPYEAMMNTIGVGNLSVASYASASMSQAASMIAARLRLHSVDWRRYRVLLMDARPGPAIRQAMREIQPDLLVLGTRGHGRFRRALLGSTAHEILEAADCDVLLVPEAATRATPGDDPGPRAA
jgi:universal stress protein E